MLDNFYQFITVSLSLSFYVYYLRILHDSPRYPGLHPVKHVPFTGSQSFWFWQWPHVSLHSKPNVPLLQPKRKEKQKLWNLYHKHCQTKCPNIIPVALNDLRREDWYTSCRQFRCSLVYINHMYVLIYACTHIIHVDVYVPLQTIIYYSMQS